MDFPDLLLHLPTELSTPCPACLAGGTRDSSGVY